MGCVRSKPFVDEKEKRSVEIEREVRSSIDNILNVYTFEIVQNEILMTPCEKTEN
jgi:hypothetical protein